MIRYFLSGILRCDKCHHGLVGHAYEQGKIGRVIRNYECPRSDRGGCGGTSISTPTTDRAVEEAMTASSASSWNARRRNSKFSNVLSQTPATR
ncbi:zinc ribbon domain-containing protein [Streptomyces noursei]|uniref:zinc ribbon domain-containing protein n=1 Tax=Streptomyces noursei TaxID=1971 RepID=UPI00380CDDCF